MLRQLIAPLLLAATAAGVVVAVVRRERHDEPAPWRVAIIKATVILGVGTAATVDGLSALGWLRAGPLAFVWSVFLLLAWGAALLSDSRAFASVLPESERAEDSEPRWILAIAGVCAVFAALAFVAAVVAPPNSWDSMTYHMPRVAHWLANASVSHYPSSYPVQLFMPPFAGYAIATVQSIAGSDRWANTVQWAAYLVAAVAASLVACRLGGRRDAQALAALALVTLPMAVSEASTAQADMMTAAWLLIFAAFVVDRVSWENALWAGAALALGVLTKPLVPFYAAPVCLLLAVRWARAGVPPAERRGRLAAAAACAAVALIVVATHAARNTRTFGLAWGGGFEVDRNRVETPGVAALASNVLRNTVLHLPVPGYGSAVARLHGALGLDPNDARTTHLYDMTFTEVAEKWFRPITPHEDIIGNPLHLVSALALLGLAFARRRRWDATVTATLAFGAAVTAGWLLIQLAFKWQPWSSRYDLPFFALLAAPLGVGLARLPARARMIVASAFVLGAVPALVLAVHRPLLDVRTIASWSWAGSALALLAAAWTYRRTASRPRVVRVRVVAAWVAVAALVPMLVQRGARFAGQHSFPLTSIMTADRTDVMFRGNALLKVPYLQVAEIVLSSGCDVVGLELRRDAWEYPLWALLGATSGGGPRIRSVSAVAGAVTHAAESSEPCLVVSSVPSSSFDARVGWSRQVLSDKPFVAVHRPSNGDRSGKPADA